MNIVHLHLLLNHVPVIGAIFALLLLAFGILKKSDDLKKASFGAFVIAALIAIPVYLTGEPAEELVENLPGVSESLIERHEAAALLALIGIIAVGTITLVGLVLFRGNRKIPAWFSYLSLMVALAAGGLMAWTASLGGQVRHSEIRAEASNTRLEEGQHDSENEVKKKRDDDDN
jgi:uncharacterized membrane protein